MNQTFLCQFSNLGFCFRYSLDEYGTARRTAVVRGLIDALTRGGEYWVHYGPNQSIERIHSVCLAKVY